MRYSLRTLIVAVVFAGSLVGSWVGRHAWVVTESIGLSTAQSIAPKGYIETDPQFGVVINRNHSLHMDGRGLVTKGDYVEIIGNSRVLEHFYPGGYQSDAIFLDADTMLLCAFPNPAPHFSIA